MAAKTPNPCCAHDRRELMTRRNLIACAGRSAFLLILPMLSAATAAEAASWTVVGKAAQFHSHTPQRIVLPDGRVVFVTRVSLDRLQAVSATCTHQGCEVGWDSAGQRFLCPCHGATYSLAGKNIRGPAKRPLAVLPVKQERGQVLINVH